MKRTWQTLLAGLALAFTAGALQADPPPTFVITQEKLPGGPVSSIVAQPVQFDARDDNRRGGFEAGVTGYILKPYFQNNPALSTTTISIDAAFNVTQNRVTANHEWDYNPAYAVWLGWTSECGLGIRARYFTFDQSADPINLSQTITPSVPGGPPVTIISSGFSFGAPVGTTSQTIAVSSDLRIQTWDLEATWSHRCGNWAWTVAAGARYLHMSQDFLSTVASSGTTAQLEVASVGRNFTGAGPTVDLEASYTFGNCGLGVYANARGSLLVGSERQTTSLVRTAVPPPSLLIVDSSTRDTNMPIAELELGVQYARDFGRLRPFLRAGVVSQTYFDAGDATGRDGNLTLFGGQVALGVRY